MAQHTPQAKLDLQRATEERDQLAALLRDACDIIEASDDPDCEAWLGQARHALAKAGVSQ